MIGGGLFVMDCDMTARGGTDPAKAVAVHDGSDKFNMDAYSAYSGTGFVGRQRGFQGTDELQGSRSTNTDYTDNLSGGAHDDSICGLTGDDIAYGNANDDLVCGDFGADVLYGGLGDDTLCGYLGADSLYGEADNDLLSNGKNTGDDNEGGPDTDTCDYSTDVTCEFAWSTNPCP